MIRPLLAVAVAAAAFAGPAHATCVGTTQAGDVCADTRSGTVCAISPILTGGACVEVNRGALPTVGLVETQVDCVEIDDVCTVPIVVPVPTVEFGDGELVDVRCGGYWWTCNL